MRIKKLATEAVRAFKRLIRRDIRAGNKIELFQPPQPVVPLPPLPIPYYRRPKPVDRDRRALFALTVAAGALLSSTPASAFNISNAESGLSVRNKLNANLVVISAKDPTYGAVGNGVANDTAAIQAALDAAFGPASNPHGNTTSLNTPVFFPAGIYSVTAPTAMTISAATRAANAEITGSISGATLTVASVVSGAVSAGQEIFGGINGTVILSGSGTTWTVSVPQTFGTTSLVLTSNIVATVNSTVGFSSASTIQVAAAVTVPANAINGAESIYVLDGTHVAITRTAGTTFTSYTSGGTISGAALNLRSVSGAHIFGAGKLASQINCTNGTTIATNGCSYSRFEMLSIGAPLYTVNGTGSGVGVCAIDLNWDNTGTVSLQACTFHDMIFGGGDFGLRIGAGGNMGSEISVYDGHFGSNAIAGLAVMNQNALEIQMIGGNCQACYRGCFAQGGSITLIQDVSLQLQVHYDIEIGSSGTFADCLNVIGCRSEQTDNFCKTALGTGVNITGCGHQGVNPGHFVETLAGGPVTIIGCDSENGDITGNGLVLYGTGNRFVRTDWLGASVRAAPALSSGFLVSRYTDDLTLNWTSYCAFAGLPAASANIGGALAPVWDSTTATVGNTITGGGSNKVLAFCNGTNWVVK